MSSRQHIGVNNPYYRYFHWQLGELDCGPACLMMLCNYFKVETNYQHLVDSCIDHEEGATLKNMLATAQSLGFSTKAVYTTGISDLIPFVPCIVWLDASHFGVVFEISASSVCYGDPEQGICTVTIERFHQQFIYKQDRGIAILIEHDQGLNN